MSVPTPVWSRPDDAVRQAQLDAMKRRATGLLALAAAVFGAAAALETRYPWLGYVRATAAAALAGGPADWFAVTALFRRPLGLPIPHTAIVATRKERIGRILGNFVQSHFLSRDVIAAKLRTMSLARRAAVWLSQPENSRRAAQQVAVGIAKTLDALPDDEMRPLVHEVATARLRTLRVAPTLGKTLPLVLPGERRTVLLSCAMRLGAHRRHQGRLGRRAGRRRALGEAVGGDPARHRQVRHPDDGRGEGGEAARPRHQHVRRGARRQRRAARRHRRRGDRPDGAGGRAVPAGDRRLHRPDRRRLGSGSHLAALRTRGRT